MIDNGPEEYRTTTEASKDENENKDHNNKNRCADDISIRRSTTGLVDWKEQWSVDFPCYQFANSNTVSYLSSR